MLKKIIFAFSVLLFLVLVVTTAIITKNHDFYSSNKLPSPITLKELSKKAVLFYSEQCTHCLKVKAFIKKRGGVKHYGITQRKIGPNMSKQDELLLLSVIKVCRMNPNQIFIPLLWTGKKCMTGDKDVINYLKQQKK